MSKEQSDSAFRPQAWTGEDAEPSRRNFLKAAGLGVGALGTAVTAAHEMALAQSAGARTVEVAQAAETPIGPRWWPSRWGADDQAGASNHITAAKVLEAAAMIRTGRIIEMGRVYETGMPMFGERVFALRIPGGPTGGVLGKNQIVWNDEYLSTEIGQVGTQFDGLGHIGVAIRGAGNTSEMRFYNGHAAADINGPYGLKKLGIENVKPIFTRGLLLDVAGLRGRMLNAGEEVTVADLTGAMTRQQIASDWFRPGDAVFVRTGWGDLWMKDNPRYNGGEPGIGVDAARWLAERQLCVVGADTWGIECVPNPDPQLAFPAHQELIVKNGIFIHENLNLAPLAEERIWQFVYVMTPLPIRGATGSPGRPIAIV